MYLYYPIPGSRIRLVARDYSEIANTVVHYQSQLPEIKIPSRSEVSELEALGLRCELPLCDVNQNLIIQLKPDLSIFVNSNAFHPLQEYLYGTPQEKNKRGDLYKFSLVHPLYFMLPLDVITTMKEYNWEQHKRQVNEWLVIKDKKIEAFRRIILTDGTYGNN